MAESVAKSRRILVMAMAMDFDERLSRCNSRLKEAKLRISIERSGNLLVLRATFPARPSSQRDRPHQQRLSTGKPTNPAGLAAAEKMAKLVAGQLIAGTFQWSDYQHHLSERHQDRQRVSWWIRRYAKEHRPTVEASTWKSDYQNVFNQLPQEKLLTEGLLEQAVLSKGKNTAQRKRFAQTLGNFGRFAGLEVDFSNLKGNYGAKAVEPRNIPNDDFIFETWTTIKHPGWKWIFGMMATFGLRNCECFILDLQPWLDGSESLHIRDGKTEAHDTWPFHPEWVDRMKLRDVHLPFTQTYPHLEDYGRRVSNEAYKRWPFSPYNLRHAWSARTVLYGIPDTVAAKMMGHSVAVHQVTYQRWLDQARQQQAVDQALARGDRPQPPQL